MWRRAAGGPPAFLGVGTHLAGTVWWRGLLAAHPQLEVRPVRHGRLDSFFEPFCTRPMTEADVAAYHRRFRHRPGVLCGEWSDRFLYHAWTLPLLARAAPRARLLLVVRDPAERYRTALSYRLGEPGRDGRTIHMTEAFHRGRYATQLRALERFFAPEQVLVCQYERCRADPRAEYRRTLRFLGVDEDVVPRAIDRPPRRPEDVGAPALRRLLRRPVPVAVDLWPDVADALQTSLRDEVAGLAALRPEVDLSLWPHFAHLAPVAHAR